MVDPIRVVCPRCGNWAIVPKAAVATCNNHEAHHHTRGEHMTRDEKQ